MWWNTHPHTFHNHLVQQTVDKGQFFQTLQPNKTHSHLLVGYCDQMVTLDSWSVSYLCVNNARPRLLWLTDILTPPTRSIQPSSVHKQEIFPWKASGSGWCILFFYIWMSWAKNGCQNRKKEFVLRNIFYLLDQCSVMTILLLWFVSSRDAFLHVCCILFFFEVHLKCESRFHAPKTAIISTAC